ELNPDANFGASSIDYVIHLAAQAGVRYSIDNPQTYGKSNLTGFLNILEWVRHNPVRHFIYASSSSVYGDTQQVPFRESARCDNPVSLY
ncbi:GDP-mannose 4,6-dehydratase, partial [Planococcus sp. SIMBA_143]